MNKELELERFSDYLTDKNCSKNTVRSYVYALRYYFSLYDELNNANLRSFKEMLLEKNSSSTVNQRLNAINAYLSFTESHLIPVKLMKIKKSAFLDNVISEDEFELFKKNLKNDGKDNLYYLVRFMASTGMRISEVLKLQVEDVYRGYTDIRSKGNKERRVYIPSSLASEAMMWFVDTNRRSGPVFRNHSGECLTDSGARYLLKAYAQKYSIPDTHVHPHAFRHRFALNFMKCHRDISMLSDLLGHESIETTRIYLKKTSDEQRDLINAIVNW